jgi:hypothetical protein
MSRYRYCTVFGSRFLFIVLAPCLLASIPIVPYMAWNFGGGKLVPMIISSFVSFACLCGLLVSINWRRFTWLLTIFALAVPICYVWYFCDEYFVRHVAFEPSTSRSDQTPWNAMMGFIVFGVPCAIFARRLIRLEIRKHRRKTHLMPNPALEPSSASVTPVAGQPSRHP